MNKNTSALGVTSNTVVGRLYPAGLMLDNAALIIKESPQYQNYFAFINVDNVYYFQVAKRNLHRPILVYHMSNLQIIDGISITDEERAKAQLYFVDQQVGSCV